MDHNNLHFSEQRLKAKFELAFWSDKGLWHRPPLCHLALTDAFCKLGEAIFGDEWIGYIGLIEDAKREKSDATAKRNSRLKPFDLKPDPIASVENQVKLSDLASPEGLARVKSFLERKALMPRQRLIIIEEFSRACEQGLVKTIYQVSDGRTFEIPAHHWAIATPEIRFRSCTYSPQEPDAEYPKARHPIFVEGSSFRNKFFGISVPERGSQRSFDEPPFVAFMLDAYQHLGMDRGETYVKDALVAAIQEYAQKRPDIHVSPTKAKYMATFLRPPEAQKGRAKQANT